MVLNKSQFIEWGNIGIFHASGKTSENEGDWDTHQVYTTGLNPVAILEYNFCMTLLSMNYL